MRTCIVCVCRRVAIFQTRAGTCRRSGAHFGMFAACVCVQVMCWAFDLAEELPCPVADAGVTSGDCVRVIDACERVCKCFKRALAPRGDLSSF